MRRLITAGLSLAMFCGMASAQGPSLPGPVPGSMPPPPVIAPTPGLKTGVVTPLAQLGEPTSGSASGKVLTGVNTAPTVKLVGGPAPQPPVPQLPATQPPVPQPPTPGGTPSDPPGGGTGTQGATEPGTNFSAEARPGESQDSPLGPTPLNKVGILQNLIYGDNADKSKIKFSGWMDFDYTYRSTGSGVNNVAPVMNRFGNEFLARQLGLYITRPLDAKEWSWGFNAIFIGGADASFLAPTAGGWRNDNPRFGSSFTDLNLTAHLPILTEGGVDIKAGRQTTVLGPMGALPWQRYFTSSDYAWYNMEEGRYTGVSANWHISKQLEWYNGVEIGGWGVFFDNAVRGVDYITQLSYWLDEEAKKTKVWVTLLTGPTSFTQGFHGKNTTTLELGLQHNWNKYWYQIVDTQMVFSRGQVFGPVPAGYDQRAYDVYTYIGRHLNEKWDINGRLEWYYDVDGGKYPGGFGKANTYYTAVTVGPDYHPTKWLQVRPEIRYDHASNPNFGRNYDRKDQLSLAFEMLFKF